MEKKTGTVTFNKKQLPAKLVNLPTVVESNKCYDGVHLFKTADVLQMLVCGDLVNKTGTGHDHPHGLAPPLKNVRKKRFRKTQRNRNVDVDEEEVEKELLWLLRMDNEAVGIARFQDGGRRHFSLGRSVKHKNELRFNRHNVFF